MGLKGGEVMPFGDGTGPMGRGPLTGREAGFCAGFPVPGYMNPAVGYGRGFGRGRGCGFRNMFYQGMPGWAQYGYPANDVAYTSAVDERAFLSNQVEFLETQLQQMKKRLDELNQETE